MQLRFQYRRYRLPFRATVRTSHGPWVERAGVIVRLVDASEGGTGAAGLGEAAPIPWFGTETVDDVEAGCRTLGEWINASALEAVPARLGCLRHALAGALGELKWARSRNAERTDATLAPSTAHAPLGVAALLPAGRMALTEIAPKAELGFRVFKWKVGVADLADELALLDDVCAGLPSGAKLRLDANGAWDRRQAERWLERCADRPVEFVEQPCFADVAQGAVRQRRIDEVLLGLAGDYPTPIALDESLIGNGDLERWIGAGWPGVFVVKPCLFADLSDALKRLDQAKANVVFSSALETALGAKTALKAAFAWGQPGLTTPADATRRVATNPAPAASTHAGQAVSSGSAEVGARRRRALGFGVWPLFADARFDGPLLAPFLRYEAVENIDAESIWNALS